MSIKLRASREAAKGFGKSDAVAREIEADILSGRLAYGQRLDSEHELVRRFSVSRTTVRKGLESLSDRGLITTQAGMGSFVTFDGQTIDNAVGWSRALASAGIEAETQILRVEILEDADLAERLGLSITAFVAVDRVRRLKAKGLTVSMECSRLPLTPELESVPLKGLRGDSLHETMRAAGLHPDHGEEWAEIHMLDDQEATTLNRPLASAFLRVRRLVRDREERVIEYVVSLLDPDHFALHLEF